MISIAIPGSVLDEIAARARANPDREICGAVLRGRNIPVQNIVKPDQHHRRFRMDPAQQMEVWNEWRRDGELVIYHSHPTSTAEPSPDDKWVITRNEGVTFVIYGVKRDEFMAYRWNGFAIISIQINRTEVSTQHDQRGTVTNGPT